MFSIIPNKMKNYGDSEFTKLEREWNETGIRPKGYDKAKSDWEKINKKQLKLIRLLQQLEPITNN